MYRSIREYRLLEYIKGEIEVKQVLQQALIGHKIRFTKFILHGLIDCAFYIIVYIIIQPIGQVKYINIKIIQIQR